MHELKPASSALPRLGMAIAVSLVPAIALAANDRPIQLAQYQVLEQHDESASGLVGPSVAQLPGEAEAPQFNWIVRKSAEGLSSSGNLPNETIGGMLALEAGGWASEDLKAADDAPNGFYRDAVTALGALEMLEEGSAGFDGATWFVEGILRPGIDKEALNEAIAYSAEAGEPWTVSIDFESPDSGTGPDDEGALAEIRSVVETLDSDEDMSADEQESSSSIDTFSGTSPAAVLTEEITEAESGSSATEPSGVFADDAESVEDAAAPEERDEAKEADAATDLVDEQAATDTPGASDPFDAATVNEELSEPEPAPSPQSAAPDPTYRISVIKAADGTLTIRGRVPDAAARRQLINVAGGLDAVEKVTIDPAAPENFVQPLLGGVEALLYLEDGRVAFENGAWLISGNARIDTDKAKALAELEQAGVRDAFRTIIAAPSARAVCEAELTAFLADKAILFGSGSTRMTAESEALLPQVAEHLSVCPDTVVYVVGHTDSDGLDSANLTLSIARAEAVVDALIELGIAPNRLYAVGYGESLPVASNDTRAGKLQNRRIVFSFEDNAAPIEPEVQP